MSLCMIPVASSTSWKEPSGIVEMWRELLESEDSRYFFY